MVMSNPRRAAAAAAANGSNPAPKRGGLRKFVAGMAGGAFAKPANDGMDSPPVGKAPGGSAPVGSTPMGSAPVGKAPLGNGRPGMGSTGIGKDGSGKGRAELAAGDLLLPLTRATTSSRNLSTCAGDPLKVKVSVSEPGLCGCKKHCAPVMDSMDFNIAAPLALKALAIV